MIRYMLAAIAALANLHGNETLFNGKRTKDLMSERYYSAEPRNRSQKRREARNNKKHKLKGLRP